MLALNATSKEVISSILNANYDYLSKICHPLFKATPLQYFEYIRYYDNEEAICFSTAPDLGIKALYENVLPTFEEFQLFSLFNQKACFLSTAASLPPGVGEVSQEKYERNLAYSLDCGVYHCLYLVERYAGYYVSCGYGLRKDNKSIINFFLNNLSYLEKFHKYFEFNSREFLEAESQNHRILLPEYHNRLLLEDFDFEFPPSKLKEFEIKIPGAICEITAREKECLSLIAQGYTMKTVALKLEISHRTVEQHLRNLKDKLGLNTKSQLVELWHTYMM